MNPSAYPQLLGGCDLGLAFEGDQNGSPGRAKLDLASCNVPIIAADSICASELIKTGSNQQTGFVFKDEFALDLALKKTITDASFSLEYLRNKCHKFNVTWDQEITSFWDEVKILQELPSHDIKY